MLCRNCMRGKRAARLFSGAARLSYYHLLSFTILRFVSRVGLWELERPLKCRLQVAHPSLWRVCLGSQGPKSLCYPQTQSLLDRLDATPKTPMCLQVTSSLHCWCFLACDAHQSWACLVSWPRAGVAVASREVYGRWQPLSVCLAV